MISFKRYSMVNGVKYISIFNIVIYPSTIAVPLYLIAFIGFLMNYNSDNNYNFTISNKDIRINKDIIKMIVTCIIAIIIIEAVPSFANASILGISYLIIATIKIIKSKESIVRKLLLLYGVPIILGSIFFNTIFYLITT